MEKEHQNREQYPEADHEEDLLKRILHVIDAVKHPDVSGEAMRRNDHIFSMIETKIALRGNSAVEKSGFRWLRYPLAAAVLLLFLMSGGYLIYQQGYKSGITVLTQSMIEVNCPMGTRTRVALPDGSHVVLNGGSKLVYPTSFSDVRRVTLEGLGYFDVAKDKVHPFVVNAGGMEVRVLGTRFSLNAYTDDLNTTLTLEEGRVEAVTRVHGTKEKILLVPDQQLVLDNRTGELLKRNVAAGPYMDWKDGKLNFRDIPLDEIARILERSFNLKITIVDSVLAREKYYVSFENGENIDQILSLLSYKNGWIFQRQGRLVEIKKI